MSLPLGLNLQARDLNIDLHDSCNCCCFGWKKEVHPETPIYVNEHGEAVKFDRKKSTDERAALQKSIVNLQDTLKEMTERRKQDHEEVMTAIRREVVDLDPKKPTPLTLDMILRIKRIAEETLPSPKGKNTIIREPTSSWSSDLSDFDIT